MLECIEAGWSNFWLIYKVPDDNYNMTLKGNNLHRSIDSIQLHKMTSCTSMAILAEAHPDNIPWHLLDIGMMQNWI